MDRITAAEVFVDVARSGSFTATAERLAMSRPMVTRYVEAMERWFGVRLLHRTTRKVTLTSSGEQCINEIEAWLAATQLLVSRVKPSDQLTDAIRIATSMSFGHAQLMAAVSEFMALHPKVTIDVDLQDSAADLVSNRIDLAIRIAADPDPSLIGKPIAKCRSVMVASQAYLDKMPLISTPDDLISHQCLTHTSFERQLWHLSRDGEHRSVSLTTRLTANEATVLLEAALCGVGISLLPTYLANKAIKQGQLVEVLPQWQANDMTIYALYSSRKFLSPTVRALIDFLSDYFKNHQWD